MKKPLKSYLDTPVPWGTSQGQIVNMLSNQEIYDVQFTNISADTARRSGLEMDKNTIAIMLVFQKRVKLPDGTSGMIPVRVIIPNVETDNRSLNQHYRLLFWYLKSKFEAIDTGLVEFAEEFMAHLQIGDNRGNFGRLWDKFKTGYYKAIGNGSMPDSNLLPPLTGKDDDENN